MVGLGVPGANLIGFRSQNICFGLCYTFHCKEGGVEILCKEGDVAKMEGSFIGF